jgi:epoxyqueuosine reductase QueG
MDIKQKNYEELKKLAVADGNPLFGVADIKPLKKYFNIRSDMLSSLAYGICIGFRLSDKVMEEIQDCPTPLYSMHYRRVNSLLDNTALKITSFLLGNGWSALPIPASVVVDWEKQTAHLSHKMIGRACGLGWIGRSGLLVNPRLGAMVRYVTVLTDMPLTTDNEIHGSCGECRMCIEVCPAKAIGDTADKFDRESCHVKLREFSKMRGIGYNICGLCVKVCAGSLQRTSQDGTDKRSSSCETDKRDDCAGRTIIRCSRR